MSDKLNTTDFVTKFLEQRERYFKSEINERRFYSEKYNFLFAVDFLQNVSDRRSCYDVNINNMSQALDILNELDVTNKETAEHKLNLIFKTSHKNLTFPCVMTLCVKFLGSIS